MAVLEPLVLTSVRRVGRRLVLAVRDEGRRRNVISFRLADASDALRAYIRACGWLQSGTRLAYVRGGPESALFDVDALFARALV
jgi:hypothetical protein